MRRRWSRYSTQAPDTSTERNFNAAKKGDDLTEYKERALDANAVQLRALTRLRFLAKPEVLKLAFELHDIEDQLYSTLFNGSLESADWNSLENKWNELEGKRKGTRIDLFNACRRNLGLRHTLPSVPSTSSGPSQDEVVHHQMKRRQSGENWM